MGTEDFIRLLQTKQGERSLREFATALGISAAYLSDIYLRNRLPGAKVADAMGYKCTKSRIVTVTFTRRRGVSK